MMSIGAFLAAVFSLNSHADIPANDYVTSDWLMGNEASSFAESLVRPCLTGSSSQLHTGGSRITVKDTSECVADIKTFSRYWEAHGKTETATLHVKDADQRKTYENQINTWKPDFGVSVLPLLGHCACIALEGTNAQYVAARLLDPQGTIGSLGTRVRVPSY